MSSTIFDFLAIFGLSPTSLLANLSPTSDLVTPIFQIQGAGHTSPLVGNAVVTAGTVTAVAFDGFYLQDLTGDGNNATADGIFVSAGSSPSVAVGDSAIAIGTVSESIPGGPSSGNLSITQLTNAAVNVLSSGNPLPAPVILGSSGRVVPNQIIEDDNFTSFDILTDGIDFYESLEGMRVTIEDPVATSATRTFSPFSSEIFTLTNNGANISPAGGRTQRGGINLTPFPPDLPAQLRDLNAERVQVQFDGTIFPGEVPNISVGDRLGNVTGVVGYSFGNFEVNATEVFPVIPSGLTPEVSSLVGTADRLTVAAYNILNLSPDASDDNQRATLASQIVNNLNAPDIIALQEIQDNSGATDDGVIDATQTLQALVDAIAAAGGPAYQFFDVAPADGTSGGVPGGNIRNAYLYNPARIGLNSFQSLLPDVLAAAGVSNPNAFEGTRNPLQAEFTFNGNTITLLNNHLTSRFGSSPTFGTSQPLFEAGESDREAETQALNEFVDSLLAADPNANVAVLGDLNTFEFTNDISEILVGTGSERVLTNLVDGLTDDNVYSFIFEGNSQILDHVLVSDNLLPGAELDIVGVNLDFPRVDDTVGSDHDPLLARFSFQNPAPQAVSGVQFLGEITFPTGLQFNGTEVGGLSGITYDRANDVYYSISDDGSFNNPARFYTIDINLSDGTLDAGDFAFTNVTTLLTPDGQPFPEGSIDPESIALTDNGTLLITSEGSVNSDPQIAPFVNEYALNGALVGALPVDDKFLPTTGDFGIRNNLAFESGTIAPSQRFFFTATENALAQDGPAATLTNGSSSRIVRYDLLTGLPDAEYVYETDPVPDAPIPADGFNTNGLVELTALDGLGDRFLALERAFSVGVGNSVRLYEVTVGNATNVIDIDSLTGAPGVQPVQKDLILDFGDLGVTLDNLEGVTIGEQLPDGRLPLIVVSDNNFNDTQFTQVLAFAIDGNPASPIVGNLVADASLI